MITSEYFHADRHRPEFKHELDGVLTIRECANRFGKHVKTVQMAIYTGRIYAEKRDADEGVKGGIWLISFASASALWGDETEYTR